jgi:probable HAF family extracellular repeat protein
MKLRFTRAGTTSSPARKMVLAGLIAALAVAGVATATIAGASTHRSSSKSYNSSAWQVSWRYRTVSSPLDSTFTQLLGINNAGTVAGYYGSGADAKHPNKGFTLSSPWTYRGNWHAENYPGSAQTQVVAINTTGATVGFFVTRTGANYGFVNWHGRMWPVAYPKTPRKNSFNQLLGINDNGIAAGFYLDSAGNSHGYLYNIKTRTFFLLRVPVKATSVVITGINNSNVIVGFVVIGKVTVAFVVKNGVFHQLSFGDKTNTQALGVNSSGSVVGSFLDAAGKMHGFLWTTTGMHQIDSPWAVAARSSTA